MRIRLSDWILFAPHHHEYDHEAKYKLIFLNNVFFFAAVVAFGMGFVRWQESALMGAIDFGFSAIALALLYCLRLRKERLELISTLSLIASFILFFAIYLLAPYNSTRLSLFVLLTASAFFLKGRQSGFVWLVFILSAIVVGHLQPFVKTAYTHLDILTACLYLIAFYFIVDKYEASKEEQQLCLEKLNLHLEEQVLERTRELQQANNELESERQLLEVLSSTDQLTGLYNRYKFEELFKFEQAQARRYGTEISIILIDLDYFKAVNDTYGHIAGDNVLKQLAVVLRGSVRSCDVVARWGGEEFIVFAPKISTEQAYQLAEGIRLKVKSVAFSGVGYLTASIGVATFAQEDSLEFLLHRADRALYRAKEMGRNNVQIEMLG